MTETYRTISFETVEPGVARIALNRPDHMNAYTNPMCDEIVHALHAYMDGLTRLAAIDYR